MPLLTDKEDSYFSLTHQAFAEKRTQIKADAKRMIWITFQREGIRTFPGIDTDHAPSSRLHMFHFTVAIEVFHLDREIDFIQFKRWLENSFTEGVMKLDYKSCEMINDELYEFIAFRYPSRDIKITVSEDDENGATIYYANN